MTGRTLAMITVVTSVLYLSANMPTMVYGAYGELLGFGPVTQVLLFVVYAVGLVPAVLLTPLLTSRVSPRSIAVVSIALGLAAIVPFLGAPGLVALFAARLLQGVSVGIVTALAVSLTIRMLRPRSAALWVTFVTSLAAALGPPVAGALIQVSGSLTTPFVVAATVLVAGAAASLAMPRSPVAREAPPVAVAAVDRRPELRGGIALQCTLVAFAMAGVGVFQSLGPQILLQSTPLTGAFAQGCLVAGVLLVSCTIQVSTAAVPSFPLRIVGLVSLVLGAAAFCAMVATGAGLLAIVAAVLVGAAHACLYLTATREASVATNDGSIRSRTLSSVYFSSVYVGLVVPSLAISLGAAGAGLPIAAAAVFAVVAVAGLVFLATLRRSPA